MKKKAAPTHQRKLSIEEFSAMFAPGALDDLAERNKTMGPFEADPSRNSPEHDARIDRWVEGYCASGHDPDYRGPAN